MSNRVLIVDFGSQVTQLIARRVREAGFYSEIIPYNADAARFDNFGAAAVILSGGPASVLDDEAPTIPASLHASDLPMLGICYGQQALMHETGGTVSRGETHEFGRADVRVTEDCALFDGLWEKGGDYPVWMSHGDKVTALAPGWRVVAASEGAPFAVVENPGQRRFAVQFHPEVHHTPDGAGLIRNFLTRVAGLTPDWSMAAFRDEAIAAIREQVGDKRVICGLSGGVDSSVAAVLIHEAIGDRLTCIFVDHGLLEGVEHTGGVIGEEMGSENPVVSVDQDLISGMF